MQLMIGHDIAVAQWMAKKLGGPRGVFIPPYTALGIVDRSGILRGGFVIRPWNEATCDLSVYSEHRALTHGVMRGMFRILFERLGFQRCVIHTERANKVMRRGAPKLGFRFECKAVNFYGPGGDALQFAMTPETCRWLKTHERDCELLQEA